MSMRATSSFTAASSPLGWLFLPRLVSGRSHMSQESGIGKIPEFAILTTYENKTLRLR